jgi:hypothetical protein
LLTLSKEDRVQWHRAWADMMRWLEEFELKHIELIRCIRSFNKMHSVWEVMSKTVQKPGHAAFARRQSTIYVDLRNDAEKLFREKGEARFVSLGLHDDSHLVDAVRQFRDAELSWLKQLAGR